MRRQAILSLVSSVLVGSMLMASATARAQTCDYDFNNDGVYPSELDMFDFLDTLAGVNCLGCDSVDINRNGVYPEYDDIVAFLNVYQGGNCEPDPGPFPDIDPTQIVIDSSNVAITREESGWIKWVATWGNDNNPGTVDLPLASVRAAVLRMRGNEHGTIYIMPGTYTMAFQGQYDGLPYGGVSSDQPLTFAAAPVVGAAAGIRPVVIVPSSVSSAMRMTNGINHVRVRGIEFRATNTHGSVLQAFGTASDLMVEDCVIKGAAIGLLFQGADGGVVQDVHVRRTIVQDQRNAVGHSQGSYVASANNVSFEDCVFWNTGNRDTFCHGVYMVHGNFYRTVNNCWFGEPGFAGVQARGGDFSVTNSVFEMCGNGIGVGHPMSEPDGIWTRGNFENNLVMNPKFPMWGIAVQRLNCGTVRNNVLLANPGDGLAMVRQALNPCATVTDNIVRGWGVPYRNFGPVEFGGDEVFEQPPQLDSVSVPGIDWEHLRSRPRGVWNGTYDARSYINLVRQAL